MYNLESHDGRSYGCAEFSRNPLQLTAKSTWKSFVEPFPLLLSPIAGQGKKYQSETYVLFFVILFCRFLSNCILHWRFTMMHCIMLKVCVWDCWSVFVMARNFQLFKWLLFKILLFVFFIYFYVSNISQDVEDKVQKTFPTPIDKVWMT